MKQAFLATFSICLSLSLASCGLIKGQQAGAAKMTLPGSAAAPSLTTPIAASSAIPPVRAASSAPPNPGVSTTNHLSGQATPAPTPPSATASSRTGGPEFTPYLSNNSETLYQYEGAVFVMRELNNQPFIIQGAQFYYYDNGTQTTVGEPTFCSIVNGETIVCNPGSGTYVLSTYVTDANGANGVTLYASMNVLTPDQATNLPVASITYEGGVAPLSLYSVLPQSLNQAIQVYLTWNKPFVLEELYILGNASAVQALSGGTVSTDDGYGLEYLSDSFSISTPGSYYLFHALVRATDGTSSPVSGFFSVQ